MKVLAHLKTLQARPYIQKVFHNIGWLSFDKLLKAGLGFILSIALARYLGPHYFGLFNYAFSFVAVFGVISNLGLDQVAVREIAKAPSDASDILTSAALLRLGAAILSIALIGACIHWLQANDPLTQIAVFLLSITLLFKSADVVRYWFEARVETKYVVWVEGLIITLSALVKLICLAQGISLLGFIILLVIESMLVSSALVYLLKKKGVFFRFSTCFKARSVTLFRDSWPLMFAGLAIMIYMRIDMIMLETIVDSQEVGIYAAATKLSEVWYFVPMILSTTLSPYLLRTHSENPKKFLLILNKLYFGFAWLAVLLALPLTVFSQTVVLFIYGSDYGASGTVLSIHLWASVAVFLGVASSQYLLAKNLPKLSLYRTLIGAIINIALNLVLIPVYGANGAAVATVASYFISVFSLFFFPSTRVHTIMLVCAPFAIRKALQPIKL